MLKDGFSTNRVQLTP